MPRTGWPAPAHPGRSRRRGKGNGSTNKEVAQALFIAEKTVQFHLTRIYAKFGVRSRSELAAVYAREGMGSTDG